jgi:hypothetical protein
MNDGGEKMISTAADLPPARSRKTLNKWLHDLFVEPREAQRATLLVCNRNLN